MVARAHGPLPRDPPHPRVAYLLAASLLARLPLGINGLAIVLLVKEELGTFGAAGVAAGALALGNGVGAPLTARGIDVLGARMLVVFGGSSAAALLAFVALVRAGAPTLLLVVVAFAAGVAFPPTPTVVRAQLQRLFAGRTAQLQTAFALDAVISMTVFTVAPLLVAALVVLFEPALAIVVSAAAALAGTAALAAALPPDERLDGARPARTRLGALAAPGIRTLVGSMVPVGFALGALEVALPAFADHEGEPELAGVLIGLWCLGSAAGGIAYGARPRRASLMSVHVRVALGLPLTFLPLALATSPATMALLVVPAGVLISPLIATRNELAGVVAPAGAGTEAYAWPITALVAGIALGAAAAGALADATSWQVAVLAAAVAAAGGAVIATGRRATLATAP